jgi:transcriptional regulator with XRE-family HTH domain
MAEKKRRPQAQTVHLEAAVRTVWSATRRDADLSQASLGERLGWTRDQVASVERGRRKVTVTDLIVFAEACGVDAERLLRRIVRW